MVEDFRRIDVLGSANLDFASLDEQGFVQGDRLEVFDRHLTRQGYDLAQLVYLTHGVVENGGDDSSVAVAWRTGVTLAESEAADRHLAVLVEGKFKAHAVGIVQAASEAVILLRADVARVVAVIGWLSWHGIDSIAGGDGTLLPEVWIGSRGRYGFPGASSLGLVFAFSFTHGSRPGLDSLRRFAAQSIG